MWCERICVCVCLYKYKRVLASICMLSVDASRLYFTLTLIRRKAKSTVGLYFTYHNTVSVIFLPTVVSFLFIACGSFKHFQYEQRLYQPSRLLWILFSLCTQLQTLKPPCSIHIRGRVLASFPGHPQLQF